MLLLYSWKNSKPVCLFEIETKQSINQEGEIAMKTIGIAAEAVNSTTNTHIQVYTCRAKRWMVAGGKRIHTLEDRYTDIAQNLCRNQKKIEK